jgi:hypothetical protein
MTKLPHLKRLGAARCGKCGKCSAAPTPSTPLGVGWCGKAWKVGFSRCGKNSPSWRLQLQEQVVPLARYDAPSPGGVGP